MDTSGDVSSAEIGRRLRDARGQRGLTLRDVAAASEGAAESFQVATLSAWERGERRIGLPALMWLADHYGVPVAQLLGSRTPGGDRPVLAVRLDRLADADPSWEPLTALVTRIVGARQDPPVGVVRLRGEDLDFLATVLDLSLPDLVQRLAADDLTASG